MEEPKGIYLRGAVYWLKFQRDGVRRYMSLETHDPEIARDRAIEMLNLPEWAPRTPLVSEVERYLAHKRRLNVFSRATERVTRAALLEFCEYCGDIAVGAVRSANIETHYRTLQGRVAETTAQIHMRALRTFFAWCATERLCVSNPALAVKLATIDRPARLRFCSAVERDALIENAPTEDLKFILLAGFHCGMRKGEIVEARAGWFDLRDGGACHIENTDTFRIKDRDARFVPLTARFRDFLRRYLAGRERSDFALKPLVKQGRGMYRYDFHRPYNEHVDTSAFCCGHWSRVAGDASCIHCRKLITPLGWVTAHVMRHTFASLLVQNGVSVFKVARWLGDGVEVVEKHYAHLAPQDSDIERMG